MMGIDFQSWRVGCRGAGQGGCLKQLSSTVAYARGVSLQ